MDERRTAPRIRTLKGGRIIFNDKQSVIDCLVRNQSSTGALLRVETSIDLPGEFDLLIEPEALTRACRIVRRLPNAVGVRFLSSR